MTEATNWTRHVAKLVQDADRPVSGDDLLPMCPGRTRRQVFQSLQNARIGGYVVVAQRGFHKGIGLGTSPGLYVATGKILPEERGPDYEEPDLPDTPPVQVRGEFGIGRIPSVFHLGNAA